MSKYEVSIESRKPCPCTKGEIIVTRYDPEYRGGRVKFKAEISCDACKETYFTSTSDDGQARLTKRS